MTEYKKLPEYQEYLAGEPGTGKRFPGIPKFEYNEHMQVKVAPGERFCRWVDADGEMCEKDDLFSNESNLRTHIKRHRVEIESHTLGALNLDEQSQNKKFYRKLMAAIRGEVEASTPAPTPAAPSIPTPSKNQTTRNQQKKKKTIKPALLELPTWTKKGKTLITISKLKLIANMTGTCEECKQSGIACPSKRRTSCHVWAKFGVNPVLEANDPIASLPLVDISDGNTDDDADDGVIASKLITNRFVNDRNLAKIHFILEINKLKESGDASVTQQSFDIDLAWNQVVDARVAADLNGDIHAIKQG